MFLQLQYSTKNYININDNLLTQLIDKTITHEKIATYNNTFQSYDDIVSKNDILLYSIIRNVSFVY